VAILTYDVGTSAVKVALFSEEGTLLASFSYPLETRVVGRKVTQNPRDWWEGFIRGARACLGNVRFQRLAVIGTGQMQVFLLLDEEGNPLQDAALYSDSDVGDYVLPEKIRIQVEEKTPNRLDDFTPFTKAMALYSSGALRRARFFIFGAKDYLNFCLTGQSVTDLTNASTTGFLDYRTLQWIEETEPFLPFLPSLSQPTEVIGTVRRELLPLLGIEQNLEVPVFNGIGDLGAVTLGAGVRSPGEAYCYLGTTGWVAVVQAGRSTNRDLFSLAFLKEGDWIVVAPLLNLGNVHRFSLRTFLGSEDYQAGEKALSRYIHTPVQVWPYLNGERVPYRNERVRSMVTRLTEGTTGMEIHAAFVRSLLFSLRHACEALGIASPTLRLVGGFTRSEAFVQYLSDVLQKPCQVVKGDAFAPQQGLYHLYLLGQGLTPPPVEIARVYFPREDEVLEGLYQEYRDFAEKLLRGDKSIPDYL